MSSRRVVKYALFLLLSNGVVFSSAQASGLAYEMSRIGNACDQARSEASMATQAQGASSSTVETDLKSTPTSQLGEFIQSASGAVAAVNTSACDGLMAHVASNRSVVDSDAHTKVLGGASEGYARQPTAVPLSAAAWLFSSALLGFIVVANRRKV